jgi:hypothetical protein
MLENTERAIKNKRQPGETDNIDKEKQNKDKILLCIICQPRGQLRSYIHVRSYPLILNVTYTEINKNIDY